MTQRPHSQRRPNIGITPDLGTTQSAIPSPRYELRAAYADAVLRGGGLPLVFPYSEEPSCVESYLDRVSGLLITGGSFDIPPHVYGEEPREGLGPTKMDRTAFESALLRAALERNLPVLGICGGMQLLNVVAGGTLMQDIGREVPSALEHEQKHDRSHAQHPVEIKTGTQLSELLGPGQVMVNSMHHQAVKQPGKDVVISAVAPDGIPEAIELTRYSFALGVQWHPENLIQTIPLHLALYRGFIYKARDVRR